MNPDTSFDFLYQMNRPRESLVIPGVKVNRLSKWSVGMILRQTVELNVFDHGTTVYPQPDLHHCLLELDINTVPGPATLPQDRLIGLLEELVALGKEIVSNGDQP